MRRFNYAWLAMILIGVQALDIVTPTLWAQSSRTAPPPVRNAGRTRLFGRNKQEEKQAEKPPAKAPVVIPGIPGAQLAANIPGADLGDDPLLTKVKKAINVNARRFLSPNDGHTPWMIFHGVLALRQEFRIRVDGKIVNGLDYITQGNPIYRGVLPVKPSDSMSPMVNVQGHWFESTAYGGRAQPYQVPFAFEGHVNQSLAILSTCDLPLNHPIVVNDSQRPGMPKTITMEDMVKSAQKTITFGNPYELAWTLWFFSNYLDPEAQWTDMHGRTWSMEQLVRSQVNAPLVVQDIKKGPPCGGTHALFALASACNSFQQKKNGLTGTWKAARSTLDYYTQAAKAGQNADGSMSAGYFLTYRQMAPNYGERLKASGHMLEWLMMALPPEQLQEPWITKAIDRLAEDLLQGQNQKLSHEDTGSLYHSVHALVLYRNRVDPPESNPPAAQTVEVPPEQRNPAPGQMPDKTATPVPAPEAPKPAPEMQKQAPRAPSTTATEPEATIRLIGPAPKRLMLQEAKPLLKPITNTRETEPLKPGDTPAAPPKSETPGTDGPERMPLLVPMPPELEKPVPAPKTGPAPGEPKSEGAIVKPLTKDEGGTEPAPLFGEGSDEKPAGEAPKTPPAPPMPTPMADSPKSPEAAVPGTPVPMPKPAEPKPDAPATEAEKPVEEPLVPPALPEPTPRKPTSAGD